MSFKMPCPGCGQHLQMEESMRGTSVKCPVCGKIIAIPVDSAPPEFHAGFRTPPPRESWGGTNAPGGNAPAGQGGALQWLKDFLAFKIMVIPFIIQAIWILFGVFGNILVGIAFIAKGEVIAGTGILVLGPAVSRFVAELLILFFKTNELLREIRNKIK